jgi:hypothetical protein
MTSLKRDKDEFQWLGGMAASALNWEPADQSRKSTGNCASLLENRFSAIPCEQQSNFMCESADSQGLGTTLEQC